MKKDDPQSCAFELILKSRDLAGSLKKSMCSPENPFKRCDGKSASISRRGNLRTGDSSLKFQLQSSEESIGTVPCAVALSRQSRDSNQLILVSPCLQITPNNVILQPCLAVTWQPSDDPVMLMIDYLVHSPVAPETCWNQIYSRALNHLISMYLCCRCSPVLCCCTV